MPTGKHRKSVGHPIRTRLAAGAAATALALTGAALVTPMASASPLTPAQSITLASFSTPLLADNDRDNHRGDRGDRDRRGDRDNHRRCFVHHERWWDGGHHRWNWRDRCW